MIKKVIFLLIFLLILHFVWIYLLPVPEINISKTKLFSIKPGMTPTNVIDIIGNPKSIIVYCFYTEKCTDNNFAACIDYLKDIIRGCSYAEKCTDNNFTACIAYECSDNFVEYTNNFKRVTWLYSEQRYFNKTLEFYINFYQGKSEYIVVEKDDLAVYSLSKDGPYIRKDNILSLYFNP